MNIKNPVVSKTKTVWCALSNLQGKNEWCNRAAVTEVKINGRTYKVCAAHKKDIEVKAEFEDKR